jgi:hypothetical protein
MLVNVTQETNKSFQQGQRTNSKLSTVLQFGVGMKRRDPKTLASRLPLLMSESLLYKHSLFVAEQ